MAVSSPDCIVCGVELEGRQRLFCSGKCRKRGQRDPARYPKPEPEVIATVTVDEVGELTPEAKVNAGGMLVTAEKTGKHEAVLKALRKRLAGEIDACSDPRTLVVLVARMVDVNDRLSTAAPATDESTGGGVLDEIAKRRAERQARRAAGS